MIQPIYLQTLNGAAFCLIFTLLVCQGIHAQDQSAVDTIDYILKNKNGVEKICNDLYDLGNYYVNKNELENANFVMEKLMNFSKENTHHNGMYDAYALAGTLAMRDQDNSKARAIWSEWLSDAKKNANDYGMTGSYYLLVKILYSEGKMDSAISVSKHVLEAKHSVSDSVHLPKFTSMLGNIYYKLGDFRSASDYYLQALSAGEKTGNEQLQSVCIGNLGMINKELKNNREAIKYYRKALALRIKNNQLHDIAGTYVGLASCYSDLQMRDSAVFLYRKALDLFNKLESKTNIALVNNNLGQLLVELNNLDTGMQHLQIAKQHFMSVRDTINLANNAWAIGDAWWTISYFKNDKSYLDKALKEMQISKNLAELKGMEGLKMNCYKSLSMIYEDMGNQAQAFNNLKLYNILNDSIRSREYTGQIAEMQTRYETEKKELEISKLNAAKLLDAEKIARQKTLNYSLVSIAALLLISGFLIFRNVQHKRTAEKHVAILEKQNAIESMRSKIASDVHDEMGANLTRLGLNAQQLLQSPAVAENEKLLAEKMALQSKEILTGMREIIWASNPANDNLKSMLGFMRQYVDRFFDGTQIRSVVNFPNDVGEVILHPEVRRNLFLILKESLNNAVKYSGSDRVEIDFQAENEKFQMRIKDYGKGFEDKIKDEFSSGMRNMQMRAEQIRSFFKLISAPGQGVEIIVEGNLY